MFLSGISDEAGKAIDVQIKAHKELGWDHMELRLIDGTNLTLVDDAKFDEVYKALNEAGMKVSCFASALANWSRDIKGDLKIDIQELATAIPRMKKLNCQFIRVMTWANKSEVNEAEWKKDSISRLKELVKMAEDGGITLVHENCDGWAGLSPENTLELLQEINSPALSLVYDTGNPISHDQDPWDYYTKVKKHISYVHIKDAKHVGDDKAFTFPGEGEGKVKEVVSDLLKSGYDGGFSIEPHVSAIIHEGKEGPTPEELYASYVKYARMLEEIVKNAG